MTNRRLVMSTMWAHGPRWANEVAFYVPEDLGTLGTAADLRRLWALSRGRSAVVLLGSVTMQHRYRDLVFAALLKARPGGRPRIFISDATWEPGSRVLERRLHLPRVLTAGLTRFAIRVIDGRHVRYGVLSTEEVETFPLVWGVDPGRVVFTPFPATLGEDTDSRDDGHLFAGGNSLRDYDLLEDALAGTGIGTRVAARWQPREAGSSIIAGPVAPERYDVLMRTARACVVPLERRVRSAGQQTYLNAMLLGKPVVVTAAPGVRDYVEDEVTGLVVAPEAEAMRAALLRVMDPANAAWRADLGRRAREYVLTHHRLVEYHDRVLLDAVGLPAEFHSAVDPCHV